MTPTGQLDHLARPRLRTGVVLGPPMRLGTGVVHHVQDPATGWYYRIGTREHFLLSRMDGRRTVEEIGAEYAEEFGRRLGPANWSQVLALLDRRRLLSGPADGAGLAVLREQRDQAQRRARRNPLFLRLPLVNPDRFFGWLAPRLAPLFTASFVVPAVLAILAVEVYVFGHIGEIHREARSRFSIGYLVPFAVLSTWTVYAIHECGHGLAAKHFGGRATELGVMWRFPLVSPYCRTDDVLLFDRRRHRVYTAFAGVFAGMLVGVPLAALHVLLPAGPARSLVGGLLFITAVTQLADFVPLLRLDGYYMLTYGLGMVDLRRSTYRFWGQVLRRDGAAVRAYPRPDRWVYVVYGLLSALVAVGLVGTVLGFWFVLLSARLGAFAAATALGLEIGLSGAVAYLLWRRRASR